MDAATHERHIQRVVEIARGDPDAPFENVVTDRQTGEILAEGLDDARRTPSCTVRST
jgi:hypothetical protein